MRGTTPRESGNWLFDIVEGAKPARPPAGILKEMTVEQIGPRSKKGRGMAKASLGLIEAMHDIAAECQPITARGVAYKLFTKGLIESMREKPVKKVSRLLRIAREQELIPW